MNLSDLLEWHTVTRFTIISPDLCWLIKICPLLNIWLSYSCTQINISGNRDAFKRADEVATKNRNKEHCILSLQAVVWKYLIKQVALLDNMYLISYIKFRYLGDSVSGGFGISLSPLSAGGSILIIPWEN